MTTSSRASTPEPASFRDPEARVVYSPSGEVLRELSARGREDWDALERARFSRRALAEGRIAATEELEPGLLRHERLPFVSYPYEWPFEMLRDAALLQLGLLDEALAEGFVLKDGSPYNVQWGGSEPVFVDVGSFEKLREGEPWAGYRQFCMLFLYPLLLQAWKGVPFQPWLRGSLDGISPQELRDLLSLRDRFRRGAFTHVVMHARLERRYEERDDDPKDELRKAGFKRERILANSKGPGGLIRGLDWEPGQSTWSDYALDTTYSSDD